MTLQDIANQLHKHEEGRQKQHDASYQRLMRNNELQDLLRELQENENE